MRNNINKEKNEKYRKKNKDKKDKKRYKDTNNGKYTHTQP